MLIFLIGMPATGKSTFGRKLAERLNYQFIDLDKSIEQEVKLSVSYIFTRYGESFFRKMERQMLQNTMDLKNTIIATGGGTPCFGDNMQWIKRSGISIFLETPLPVIAERIMRKPTRPLFQHKNQAEVLYLLEEMYQKRRTFYLKSDFVVRFDFE